jgi:hypothetical protein
VTIGQDSLTVTSASFKLTAVRTGETLTMTDEQSPGTPGDDVVATATQTKGTFDAGAIPFDLGGTWAMKIVPAGGSAAENCNVTVSATEIDCSCKEVGSAGIDFSFKTKKDSSAASSFGDFGGKWTNTWVWPGKGGGTYPCELAFTGNDIKTCAGGAKGGQINGSPLAGITFTWDGANTVSGAADGWAEFSATR